MKLVRSFLPAIAVVCVLAGCAASPSNPLSDLSKFSGMYAQVIENACNQTLICTQMKNTQTDPQYQTTCQNEAANMLNDTPSDQPGFLSGAARCGGFTGCEYQDCTHRTSTGYGDQQIDKLTYLCAQKVQCDIESGHAPHDPTQAAANCTGQLVGVLYNYSTNQRAAFETNWPGCSMQVSCAFIQCFPY